MASKEPTLDEISWQSRVDAEGIGGIHSNSILFYFARSPFFDPTSNNAIVEQQAWRGGQAQIQAILGTREAFQGRLKNMSGLEFMVAQEPAEMAPGTGTGVWVIVKQTRRKRQGEEDEITPHAYFFVVDVNIFMAQTVADIMSMRMLSIISSMNKFISTASSLPEFSPSLGNIYMPPPSQRLKTAESQAQVQTSKENTPLPDTVANAKKAPHSSNVYLDSRLLDETLTIQHHYGDEYMDENLITGQPGDFHLSTAGRKDKGKLTVPAHAKGPFSTPTKPTATPTPPTLKTDIPPARKGSKSDKSPKTPGGGPPKPKRRKSKGLTSGGISPT